MESFNFPLEGGVVCLLGGNIVGILWNLIGLDEVGVSKVCDRRPVSIIGLFEVFKGLFYVNQVIYPHPHWRAVFWRSWRWSWASMEWYQNCFQFLVVSWSYLHTQKYCMYFP